MTKINIIEFTERSISMPKTPYQINDWEVTSYKNEPMNLWKYFHKNGPEKIVDDAEYVLLLICIRTVEISKKSSKKPS